MEDVYTTYFISTIDIGSSGNKPICLYTSISHIPQSSHIHFYSFFFFFHFHFLFFSPFQQHVSKPIVQIIHSLCASVNTRVSRSTFLSPSVTPISLMTIHAGARETAHRAKQRYTFPIEAMMGTLLRPYCRGISKEDVDLEGNNGNTHRDGLSRRLGATQQTGNAHDFALVAGEVPDDEVAASELVATHVT